MGEKILTGVIILLVGAALLGLGMGGWWLQKTVNYKLQYQSMVVKTIEATVKPECLRVP